MLTAVERLHAAGYGKMYDGRPQTAAQAAYLLFTVVALSAINDTWFYWVHLLSHRSKWLYRHAHSEHHKLVAPTALGAYSFSTADGAVLFVWLVWSIFLLPIQARLHRLYNLWMMLVDVGVHAGYELAPFVPSLEGLASLAWVDGRTPCDKLTTVRHHDLHHQRPKGNYGLYFTFWDRLMGTEHADYGQLVAGHARTEPRDGLALKRLAYVSMASGIGLGVWSSL